MRNEILEYRPDMLILDYGFVDPLVWGDDLMAVTMFLPVSRFFKSFLNTAAPVFANSLLITDIQTRFLLKRLKYDGYIKTMQAILRIAEANKIPVILVKQHESRVPMNQLRDLLSPKVHSYRPTMCFQEILQPMSFTKMSINPGFWKSILRRESTMHFAIGPIGSISFS